MANYKQLSVYAIPTLMALLAFGGCYYMANYLVCDFHGFYAKNMRGSLFAGFLTLGSFLLALKTGIVIKIKEGLYDKESYQKLFNERREIFKNEKNTLYGPLRRLSKLLSLSVLSALITAILQLSIGLYPHWITASICISMAVFAISILLVSFYFIQVNLSDWFNHIESDHIKKIEKLSKEK